MPSVYLETTIPSYLVARPSPDGELAAKQAITRAWWENHRHSYELVMSTSVLDEARNGNPNQRDLRLASLVGSEIVHIYEGGRAYEVEFVDGSGHTVALITVSAEDVGSIAAGELLHARRTA